MSAKVLRWLSASLWATVIFILSAMSAPPMPPVAFPFKDKIGHSILYAGFGWLLARAVALHTRSLQRTVLLAILIGSAYGVSDELHQRFVPYRSCDVVDWMADTLGVCVAAGIFYVYESRRSAKANRQAA